MSDVTATPQTETLAQTSVVVDMSNRREIPVSGFDLLNGEFTSTRRARLLSLVMLGLVLVLVAVSASRVFLARTEVAAAADRATALENQSVTLAQEFGDSGNGVSAEALLNRDREMTSAFLRLADIQGDFAALVSEISSLNLPGAQVTGISFGTAAAPPSESSSEEGSQEGSQEGSDDPTAPAEGEQDANEQPATASTGVWVTVTVTGADLASTATAAEQVLALPLLVDATVSRSSTNATISARLNVGSTPRVVLERLGVLGIALPEREGDGA